MNAEIKEVIGTLLSARAYVFSVLHRLLGSEPTKELLDAVSSEESLAALALFEGDSEAAVKLKNVLAACRILDADAVTTLYTAGTKYYNAGQAGEVEKVENAAANAATAAAKAETDAAAAAAEAEAAVQDAADAAKLAEKNPENETVKTAAEAAEAAAAGGPLAATAAETAQKAYEAAVASHASMIDPQIFSAIIFALIGFSLVTGIEIAGKMMKK